MWVGIDTKFHLLLTCFGYNRITHNVLFPSFLKCLLKSVPDACGWIYIGNLILELNNNLLIVSDNYKYIHTFNNNISNLY